MFFLELFPFLLAKEYVWTQGSPRAFIDDVDGIGIVEVELSMLKLGLVFLSLLERALIMGLSVIADGIISVVLILGQATLNQIINHLNIIFTF